MSGAFLFRPIQNTQGANCSKNHKNTRDGLSTTKLTMAVVSGVMTTIMMVVMTALMTAMMIMGDVINSRYS